MSLAYFRNSTPFRTLSISAPLQISRNQKKTLHCFYIVFLTFIISNLQGNPAYFHYHTSFFSIYLFLIRPQQQQLLENSIHCRLQRNINTYLCELVIYLLQLAIFNSIQFTLIDDLK